MLELKPITLNQYIELEDTSEYDFAMLYANKFSEAKNTFNLPDFREWSFGFVNDYTFMLNNGMNILQQIEYILKLFSETNIEIEIGKLMLDEYCHLRNFINESIIEISQIENELLGKEPTQAEISAGIETKFQGLQNHIKLSFLCNGDLTKAKKIEALSWSFCFNELLYRSRTKEFQTEFQKIINQK
jgi:hypothetical protein